MYWARDETSQRFNFLDITTKEKATKTTAQQAKDIIAKNAV